MAWGRHRRLSWPTIIAPRQGISQDNAKKLGKTVRDAGPKGVRTQVQGDELRVFSKKKDDLQAVMAPQVVAIADRNSDR